MLKLSNIKKGNTFYECEYGVNVEFIAITNPVRVDGGWGLYAREVETGVRTKFFEHDSYTGGLKLYGYPAYAYR